MTAKTFSDTPLPGNNQRFFFGLQPKHLAYLSVRNSGYKQMKNVDCSRGLLSDIETHTVDTSFIQKNQILQNVVLISAML